MPKFVQVTLTQTDTQFVASARQPSPTPPIRRAIFGTTAGRVRVDVVEDPATGGQWLRGRGIQYAEHPTADRRWQPPARVQKWVGVKDAFEYGPDCVISPLVDRLIAIGPTAAMGEGCLFLNVFAPLRNSTSTAAAAEQKLPVLFWIYGGSFTMGGSSTYNGDRVMLDRRSAVLVTVNYRLGALGWLGGAAVARSSTDGSAGNFGLQDTRLALAWVRENIAAFGGDPARVTIVGESAGASIVATHLAAPRSAGLFNRAIMESGAFDNYTVQADPELGFTQFVAAADCKQSNSTGDPIRSTDRAFGDGDAALECLRKKPLVALLRALGDTSAAGLYSPTVDGVELDAPPEVYAATGRLNAVDAVLLGTNLNEGRYLMPLSMPVPNAPHSSVADLRTWLAEYYPSVADQVDRLYAPVLAATDPWQTAASIYTDSQYLCPTQRSARWLVGRNLRLGEARSKDGSGKITSRLRPFQAVVWVYQLRYEPSIMPLIGDVIYWANWCRRYTPCIRGEICPILSVLGVYLVPSVHNVSDSRLVYTVLKKCV